MRSECSYRRPSNLVDVAFVQCGSLAGNKARIGDHMTKFCIVGTVLCTRRADHIFFDHDASHVVYAKAQADLADLETHGEPRHLNVGNVVQEQTAQSEE